MLFHIAANMQKIAYKEDGRPRRYTPDFFVERSHEKQVIEIKPRTKIDFDKNRKLFQSIAYICQSKGWDFLIITDEMIRREPILSNIKLLYRYALVTLTPEMAITCHQYFKNQSIVTLKIAEDNLIDKGIKREILMKFIFIGFLSIDLMTTIGNNRLIYSKTNECKWEQELFK